MVINSIFEIDPRTNEATGQVHPFCTNLCLQAMIKVVISDIVSRGLKPAVGEDDTHNHCDGAVCEFCGNPL